MSALHVNGIPYSAIPRDDPEWENVVETLFPEIEYPDAEFNWIISEIVPELCMAVVYHYPYRPYQLVGCSRKVCSPASEVYTLSLNYWASTGSLGKCMSAELRVTRVSSTRANITLKKGVRGVTLFRGTVSKVDGKWNSSCSEQVLHGKTSTGRQGRDLWRLIIGTQIPEVKGETTISGGTIPGTIMPQSPTVQQIKLEN